MRHKLLLSPALVAALVLSACGGDDKKPDAGGLAAAVPARAALYAEMVVRPRDPLGRRVVEPLLRAAGAESGVALLRERESWLGERAAVALTGAHARARRPDVLAIFASRDDARARSLLEPDSTARSHRGVDYRVRRGRDFAAAVSDGRVLVGSERSLKAAIDATKGDGLADNRQFIQARRAAGTDGLGALYVDPRGLIEDATTAGAVAPTEAQAAIAALAAGGLKAIAARLVTETEKARADVAALGMRPAATTSGASAAALRAAPAGAWFAAGIGDLAAAGEKAIAQIADVGGIGLLGPDTLLRGLKQQTGVDVRADLLAWMGNGTVWATGRGRGLRAALVIRSKNPAASRRGVAAVAALLQRVGADFRPLQAIRGAIEVDIPGSTIAVQIAARRDRFAIAAGRGALAAALADAPPLGATARFRAATGALGGGTTPTLFLDPRGLLRALEGAGGGRERRFLRYGEPVLDAFGAAAGGPVRGGDARRLRFAAPAR